MPIDLSEVTFRSDVTVTLVEATASDVSVVQAARVSTQGEGSQSLEEDPVRLEGLINYLMRARHGSPFEHTYLKFYVAAPIFVFREFHRHRIASYNEESGRYKQLDPVFYVPGPDRRLGQVGKPGHYTYVAGTPEQHALVEAETVRCCTDAYDSYLRMLEAGVTREVARIVLPVTIFSSMYVTMNARALMNFVSLRVGDETAMFPSTPQREIEMCAQKMEAIWAELMPYTHKTFQAHGRVCP